MRSANAESVSRFSMRYVDKASMAANLPNRQILVKEDFAYLAMALFSRSWKFAIWTNITPIASTKSVMIVD